MKNLMFVFIILGLGCTPRCDAQECLTLSENLSIAEKQMEGVIELWCEKNFESCFGWEFVDVTGIHDYTPLPNGKIMVTGTNRNLGLGGQEFHREFKATISCVNESTIEVEFKKQQKFRYAPDSWLDCTKRIYLD